MTVKQLMEKSTASIYIVDNQQKILVTPWNIIYDAFQNCVIENIETGEKLNSLEITLKTQLVRE